MKNTVFEMNALKCKTLAAIYNTLHAVSSVRKLITSDLTPISLK